MAIMEISVVPLGLGKTSVGDYIAAVVKYLETANLPHELTDMGTLVQGAPGDPAPGGRGPARASLQTRSPAGDDPHRHR